MILRNIQNIASSHLFLKKNEKKKRKRLRNMTYKTDAMKIVTGRK